MAWNDAKESLLSDTKDHSLLSEENELHKRRHPGCSTAASAVTNRPEQRLGSPSRPEAMSINQQFNIKHAIFLLAAYLGGGTLCFHFVRNQIKGQKTNGILDAIYFCVVTMTTVGYGDLVPDGASAKLLASIYVFIGMALVGLIFSKAADYMVEKQEILVVRAIYLREKLSPPEILKEVETQKVKYKFIMVAVLLLVLIIVGTVFLSVVEELNFIDAFYCVCSTITTLGYGDESFSTTGGRLFAIFWILSSTICLALFFLYLAELYTERRQISMAKWVLTRKLTFSDLEAADLDHDKVVSAAEFVIYKLKEMGKISSEEVSLVMETFKRLDADQSGTLTPSDLILSQPEQNM